MQLLGFVLALNVIALTVFLLVKRCPAAITLLLSGCLMFILAYLFDMGGQREAYAEGGLLYGILESVYLAFKSRIAEAGLLIMFFGGYIEYMKKINASDEMVFVFMRSLSVLKNYPYLATFIVIPIGILIYMAIPSATAMGMLLVATLYPVLLGIGLPRASALSIISVCTAFDVGLASINSNAAAGLLGVSIMQYFSSQLSMIVPLAAVLVVSVYFTNKLMDRRSPKGEGAVQPYSIKVENWSGKAPVFYSILPLLPMVILLILPHKASVVGNVAVAIFISFVISGTVDSIVKKSALKGLREMNAFWTGLGRICSSAVVLMICADIFAQGLVRLAVPDLLVSVVSGAGSGKFVSLFALGLSTFLSTFMLGSGVSYFSSIAPLLPEMALSTGLPLDGLTMATQFIAGFARTASPIAIVVITVSEVAGVSPIQLVKRNVVPMMLLSLTVIILAVVNF